MAFADRTETFDAPIDKIMSVLTDYESYPSFMDGVSKIEILEKDGNKVKAKYHINIIKKFSYIIDLVSTEDSVSWTFDSGDLFSSNNGSWKLKDLGNGKTEVTYNLDVEFKVKVPGMISRKLVSSNLPSMMKSVHKKAKSL